MVKSKKKLIHQRVIILISTLILIVIFSGLFIFAKEFHKNNNRYCNQAMIDQASSYIGPNTNLPKLSQLTTKIVQTKNSDRDPNCMYIVTIYFIYKSDNVNSSKYLDKLNSSLSTSKISLDSNLVSRSQYNLKTLNGAVLFLSKSSNNKFHGMGAK